MSVVGTIVTLGVALLLLALALSPLLGIGLAIILWLRARGFRAIAARVRGTVLESPVSSADEGAIVPNGAGGVTYIPGRTRLLSRPVVSYPGPAGEALTRQVRFSAPQIYVYGQPVDLLVDPRDPRDVRLVAADGARRVRMVLTTSILVGVVLYGGIATLVVVVSLIS